MLFMSSSVLILVFCACFSSFADTYGDTSFQLPEHGSIPPSYGEDDSIQPNVAMYARNGATGKIIPLYSSVSNGPADISVQQNVSQLNICSSNTAYCYNEVDNDFNVNPP